MSDTASSAAYRQRKQSVAQATGGTWRDAGGREADGTHAAKTNIVLVWVAYAITIACNAAFEVFALGGTTSAEVSGEVFAWFTPAGYVFAIWSVIYIGLAAWLVSYSGEASHDEPMGSMRIGRTAVLFTVSCALNIAWLALWHFELFVPSIIVIAALLATIGLLYRRVHVESTRLIDRVPISLYFAWLCVATVADIAHVATRFTGAETSILQPVSTLVLAVAFFALAVYMKRAFNDYAFGVVIVWAVVGIGVHLMTVNLAISVITIMLSGLGALAVFFPWEKYRLQPRR